MDLRRLRAGEWLAAAAGVMLIVSLRLPWYEGDSGEITGFRVFSVIDILLVLAAAVGIALACLQATQASQALPVAFGVLTVAAGLIALLLTLYRLIDAPGVAPDEFIDVREGAWLGLASVVLLIVGGWLSIKNEHVRHLPPGPEPELRSAPTG